MGLMNWNQRYEDKDTPWERGEPAPPLVEYLEKHSLSGRAIVPGCGLGNDARYLAEKGLEVLGVDIAPLAIQQARAIPAPAQGFVEYRLCDFLGPNNGLPRAHFEYLFEHTCFCTIAPELRADYVAAAHRALKPGGQLIGIFFTHLEDAGNPPYHTPHEIVESAFSAHFDIIDHWRPTRVFTGRENEESVYLMRKR